MPRRPHAKKKKKINSLGLSFENKNYSSAINGAGNSDKGRESVSIKY